MAISTGIREEKKMTYKSIIQNVIENEAIKEVEKEYDREHYFVRLKESASDIQLERYKDCFLIVGGLTVEASAYDRNDFTHLIPERITFGGWISEFGFVHLTRI